MKRRKLAREININLVPMIDVTSFILLSLGILVMSMKKEASLDNVLILPEVAHASKQDTAQLQIYILPASLLPGGYINPDSTGPVAFMGKASVPLECPKCGLRLRDQNMQYIPNTLLDITGKKLISSIQSMGKQSEAEVERLSKERPQAYLCSQCKTEISPYLRLDEIPPLLKAEKEKVVKEFMASEKASYFKMHGQDMPPEMEKAHEDSLKHRIPLMIKADNEAFYGRILQVINMTRDTTCDIRKFAFISSSMAAEKAQKKAIK